MTSGRPRDSFMLLSGATCKPPPEAETRILRIRRVRVKVIVKAISVLVVKE